MLSEELSFLFDKQATGGNEQNGQCADNQEPITDKQCAGIAVMRRRTEQGIEISPIQKFEVSLSEKCISKVTNDGFVFRLGQMKITVMVYI